MKNQIPDNRMMIFSSFEEAKQNEINFIIKQSPVERLRQTVALTLRIYNTSREGLRERNNFKKITILKSQ